MLMLLYETEPEIKPERLDGFVVFVQTIYIFYILCLVVSVSRYFLPYDRLFIEKEGKQVTKEHQDLIPENEVSSYEVKKSITKK